MICTSNVITFLLSLFFFQIRSIFQFLSNLSNSFPYTTTFSNIFNLPISKISFPYIISFPNSTFQFLLNFISLFRTFDVIHYTTKRRSKCPTHLCDAFSEQAKTLDTWFSSLILSTQNLPLGKVTPSIFKPPSGNNTASFASPKIVKLSERGHVGKPGTISTEADAFGNKGVGFAASFRWAHECLKRLAKIFPVWDSCFVSKSSIKMD